MGLFDESESDDDDDGINAAAVEVDNNDDDDDEEEEEEDPLDAYMKSIDHNQTTTATAHDDDVDESLPNANAANPRHRHGGRLDVDAEEEATSHWAVDETTTVHDTIPHGNNNVSLLEKYYCHDDEKVVDHHHTAAAAAISISSRSRSNDKSELYSPFLRAGGQPSREDTNNDDKKKKRRKIVQPSSLLYNATTTTLEEEDDDDDVQLLQLHREEIDPLEHVDHTTFHYSTFRRTFHISTNTHQGQSWRTEHNVVCTPPIYDPILGFGDLVPPPPCEHDANSSSSSNNDGTVTTTTTTPVFPEELTRTIVKCGYDSPTIVQSQTLSVALSGRDALITAATGSGKTLAYIWPMVVHIYDQRYIESGVDGPIGLVLTPTRELAKQVYQHAKKFIECIGGKAVEVSGGHRGTYELIKRLKLGCEIIVGSPGRVIDIVRKKGTNLRRVTFLVLDEADRMLDMGFEKQVHSILENIRPDRQTLLLSATFGKRVEKVARSWLRNPVRIAIGQTGASSEYVDSHVMVLPSHTAKVQWLVEMLPILTPLGRCLIFVSTRVECDNLCRIVEVTCYHHDGAIPPTTTTTVVVSIHGEKVQHERNSAISKFKKNEHSILIATDVAARGLDISDVMVVVNFDAAKNLDAHVHRVGRAGRLRKNRGIRASSAIGTTTDAAAATTTTGEQQQKQQQHQRGVAYTLLTEKDANFATSLAEAFDREGREVSPELAQLCQKSSRYGGGRVKHSKDGLGFGSKAASGSSAGTSAAAAAAGAANVSHYYGPTQSTSNHHPPPSKRSRWSS